jgi:hypothetical protein
MPRRRRLEGLVTVVVIALQQKALSGRFLSKIVTLFSAPL